MTLNSFNISEKIKQKYHIYRHQDLPHKNVEKILEPIQSTANLNQKLHYCCVKNKQLISTEKPTTSNLAKAINLSSINKPVNTTLPHW